MTFRCDGSLQVGGGHIMRCLTLADAFADQGFACRFITNVDAVDVIPAVSKYQIIDNPNFEPDESDVLVVDNYALNADYEAQWRGHAKVIAVIDDLADRAHDCDVLIDQTYGRDARDYASLMHNKSAIMLCGSQYALLRNQFSEYRQASLERSQSTTRAECVIVSFGSTNPASLTQKTLKELFLFEDWALEIDVIMGAQAQGRDEVSAMLEDTGMHKTALHVNVSNMADIMAQSDIAIGAGGTTSWERCCLGLPTLLIELAGNQTVISQNLDKAGAVKYLGRHQSLEDGAILQAFSDIHQQPEGLKIMSKHAAKICDGDGARRIVHHIKDLL